MVPLHLSVQVLEAIHREKILVQKKRQGRGFRGVFGKVQTYTTYVFSIYDLQVQRLGMETFRSLATKETEAEQQVSLYIGSILLSCECRVPGRYRGRRPGSWRPCRGASQRGELSTSPRCTRTDIEQISQYQDTGFEFVEINYLNLTYPTYINLLF